MKVFPIGAISVLATAINFAGCNANAPQTQAQINQAFATMCSYLPSLGPLIGQLNGQIQGDYAMAQTICAAGTPTNPAIAGMDILSVYVALAPYFADVRVKATPKMNANLSVLNAVLRARGLM